MNNEQNQESDSAEPSQTAKTGWGVGPSPLNVVKLELAVVIIVGIVLALVTNAVAETPQNELLVLASYGLIAGGGLILRTRYLVRRVPVHGTTTRTED